MTGDELTPAQRAELDSHAKRIREGVEARIRVIQTGLGDWLKANTTPADSSAVGIALLRMGIGGSIDRTDVDTTQMLVDAEFERAIKRREDGFTAKRRIGNA